MKRFLSRHGLTVLVVLALAFFVVYQRIPMYLHARSLHGTELPSIILSKLNGGKIDLAAFRDSPVLIVFWATWCLPCRVEMPSLVSLKEELGQRSFEILAVTEEPSSTVSEYIGRSPINFPVLLDEDSSLHRIFKIEAYPTLIYVDRGRVEIVAHGLDPFLKFKIRHRLTGQYF